MRPTLPSTPFGSGLAPGSRFHSAVQSNHKKPSSIRSYDLMVLWCTALTMAGLPGPACPAGTSSYSWSWPPSTRSTSPANALASRRSLWVRMWVRAGGGSYTPGGHRPPILALLTNSPFSMTAVCVTPAYNRVTALGPEVPGNSHPHLDKVLVRSYNEPV